MNFEMGGIQKNYIKMGNVMTDESYRNRRLRKEYYIYIKFEKKWQWESNSVIK